MLQLRRRQAPARRDTPRIRWRVWVRALELDRQIAAGVAPASSPELELRTLQLCAATTRKSFADALRSIVRGLDRPRGLPHRVRPLSLASARDALLELAETLEDPDANSATGVARASWLLTDGSGPLYSLPADELRAEIELAIDALWGLG